MNTPNIELFVRKSATVILAGGKGSRMGGDTPKILKKAKNVPIIIRTLDLLDDLGMNTKYLVVGYKANDVKEALKNYNNKLNFCYQKEQLGTGHAAKVALDEINKSIALKNNFKYLLIMYGDDSFLYKKETIEGMIKSHLDKKAQMTILTLSQNSPTKVGCVEYDINKNPIDVLSYSEMLEKDIKKNDVLCGLFIFNINWLEKHITKIKKGKLKGEYPLPALIKITAQEKKYANVFRMDDVNQWNSVNTPIELQIARVKLGRRFINI